MIWTNPYHFRFHSEETDSRRECQSDIPFETVNRGGHNVDICYISDENYVSHVLLIFINWFSLNFMVSPEIFTSLLFPDAAISKFVVTWMIQDFEYGAFSSPFKNKSRSRKIRKNIAFTGQETTNGKKNYAAW